MSKERILPKSLHTITVLENLTLYLMRDVDNDTAELFGRDQLRASSMKSALRILKLDTLPDSHGLAAIALRNLERRTA